jgi:hypothetical protein
MDWLWILLRYLFPSDPVRQCIAAARHAVAQLASDLMQEDVRLAFRHDEQARRNVACPIQVYEHLVRTAIAARPFGQRLERPCISPRAKDLIDLLARLGDLAGMCRDIERLAQRHAVKLTRLHAADPLGLEATSPLRHAATRCAPTKTKGPLSPAGLSHFRSAEAYCAGAAGAAAGATGAAGL